MDMYAFGVTMFELLACAPSPEAAHHDVLLSVLHSMQQRHKQEAPLEAYRQEMRLHPCCVAEAIQAAILGLPDTGGTRLLAGLIAHCMLPQPTQRITASEVLLELERFTSDPPLGQASQPAALRLEGNTI
jgi:hypothetical protein